MIFDKTIYVSDIISIISLISAVVGGFFAYVQWKETVRNKRADYINDLTEKIRTDEDIRDIIYLLEYDEFVYDETFHGSGELERKIDKTLSHFSYICYLYKTKQITLWGSPRVVKKWVKFRENGTNPDAGMENLFLLEEIMNDMRKDLGVHRVDKGNLLGFFVNDIKEVMKTKKK